MKFLVVFAVGIALAHAALVRRDAPTPLQELQKNAQALGDTFDKFLKNIAESKDTKDFQASLKANTDVILNQVSAFSNTLQEAAKDATGKAKELLETSRANLEKTVEDLRKAHPEVEQQATELRNKLTAAVQTTAQETQKLAKEVAANVEQTNQKLAPQLKQAYDDFVKKTEEVQKKLHEVASKQ